MKERQVFRPCQRTEKGTEHDLMLKLNVDGALVIFFKSLTKELEELKIGGRAETIQTTVLMRSTRILRRILKTLGDSDSGEGPSAKAGVKHSLEII